MSTINFYNRIVAALVFALVALTAVAQTEMSVVTHVMQKGETLQTIASRYSTTPQAIIELNPEAAEFTYVGMELKIPAVTATAHSTTPVYTPSTMSERNDVPPTSYSDNASQQNYVEDVAETNIAGTTKFAGEYGALFISKNKKLGADGGRNFGMKVNFGMQYYITEAFYGNARLGYQSVIQSLEYKNIPYINSIGKKSEGTKRISCDVHLINLPLELGFSYLLPNTSIRMGLYAGLDLGVGVAGGKVETSNPNGSKTKTGEGASGELFAGFTAGLNLLFDGYGIRPSVVLGLNDNYKGLLYDKAQLQICIFFLL